MAKTRLRESKSRMGMCVLVPFEDALPPSFHSELIVVRLDFGADAVISSAVLRGIIRRNSSMLFPFDIIGYM